MPDHAFGVDDKQGWPALQGPFFGNGRPFAGAVAAERAPGDLLLFILGFERFGGVRVIAVDAEENKRLAFQLLHERPLVWEHRHAGASPMRPEVEQDHLAAIVAELELL